MCDYRTLHFADKDLSFEQIRHMLEDARDLGCEWLDLTGGEPLMRKDILDIIASATSLGLKVSMCTNGTLIDEHTAERLLEAGLVTVVVSLEGPRELNDALRGGGNYEKTMRALSWFVREKHRMEHVKVGVIISKMNFRYLADFTKFLFEEVGITSISFNPFTKWMLHVNKHTTLEDFVITEDLLPALRMELEKIIAYAATSPGLFPAPSYFRKIPDYFADGNLVPDTGCTLPLAVCGVEAEGTVYPCLMEHIPAGNVREASLKTIISGAVYQDTCRRALTRNCEGCLSACYEKVHSREERKVVSG